MLAVASPAAAQNEDALKTFFEGKHVTVKIDMPGTQDGVDVRADAARDLDAQEYGNRLKIYGTAISAGDSAVVTQVKVKKDLIEFHLGGGGFGTFGDDTSTTVYMAPAVKSKRESDLETLVKDESDSRRRRELQVELDDLRDRRDRENRRIDAERARAEEIKKAALMEKREHGGSRFNIRYSNAVPSGIRPEEVMAALGDYVDFAPAAAAAPPPATVSGDLQLRTGMLRSDLERTLGPATESSTHAEGNLTVTTLVFPHGNERVTADFVGDVLVHYTIASK